MTNTQTAVAPSPNEFQLTAITNRPALIQAADDAGVDRIGIDIERLGKFRRQGHIPDARVSTHRLENLAEVANTVRRASVFIRINPSHAGTRDEIERSLSLGAQVLMLPQFTGAREADEFVSMIRGRAQTILLIETLGAIEDLDEIVRVGGVDEIMAGLNDLHMALGAKSHFEIVVSGVIDRIAGAVLGAGLRFGFGGVARAFDDSLPVPSDLVLAQYARTGATSAWLSRSFFHGLDEESVPAAVESLRKRLNFWAAQTPQVLEAKRRDLAVHLNL